MLLGVILGVVIIGGFLVREAFVSFDYSRMPGVNVPTIVNLATPANGARARMSSHWPYRLAGQMLTADKILDGNPRTFANTGPNDPNKWIEVQLKEVSSIESVVIGNRMDCCQYRLKRANLEFYKGGQMVRREGINVNGQQTFTYYLSSPVEADRVRYVQLEKDGISMSEMKIFGYSGVDTGSGKVMNLATKGNGASASMSSTYPHIFQGRRLVAENVLDENPDTMAHSASNGPNEWIEVKLGGVSQIETVEIVNRKDCCQFRLNSANLEFYKGGQLVKTEPINVRGQQTFSHTMSSPVIADRVRLVQLEPQLLNIAGMKVIGRKE